MYRCSPDGRRRRCGAFVLAMGGYDDNYADRQPESEGRRHGSSRISAVFFWINNLIEGDDNLLNNMKGQRREPCTLKKKKN